MEKEMKGLINTRYRYSILGLLFFLWIHVLVGQVWAAPEEADGDVASRSMGHGDASEIVVARVSGANISMATLMGRMLDIAEDRYGKREITPSLAGKIKAESIEQLITEELVFQTANREVNITPDELNIAVAARIKYLGGEEVLKKYMQAYQLKNRAAFSEQIRRVLVIQKYIKEKIEPKIKISDAMISEAYRNARGEYFNKPEVVQVSKIIFFLDPSLAESYAKVRKVRTKLVTELAGDTTKLIVDGTFIVQDNIKLSPSHDKNLYDAGKKLDKFAISDVVESAGSLHLIKLTGYQTAVHKAQEEVTGYLRNKLFNKTKKAMIKDWMDNLRQGAEFEIIDVMQ